LSTALTALYCLVRPETTIWPSDIFLLSSHASLPGTTVKVNQARYGDPSPP
jgi:hypothetical protein